MNPDGVVDNTNSNAVLNEEEKPNFFGIYSSNPSNFVFLRGERKMVEALVDHVKSIEAEHSSLGHFEFSVNGIDRMKITWKGTFQSKFGMHFGQSYAKKKQLIRKDSTEDLRTDLFEKFQKFLHEHYKHTVPVSSQDLIEINFISDSVIDAKVQCIFCHKSKTKKKIKIHCQTSKNTHFWIFSNLKRHMDKHGGEESDIKKAQHVHIAQVTTTAPERSFVLSPQETDVTDVADDVEDEGGSFCGDRESQFEDSIFTQLSVQNLKMQNAIIMHNEIKNEFSFNLGDDISADIYITNIKSDGNCMFGALAHQLFYLKVNSVAHEKATEELRLESSDFIKKNYTLFAHEIKGRILHTKRETADIDKECNFFVNICLPRPGCWGGFESLKAISCVHKINILIFNEDGDYYFADRFNPSYDRSVYIAFRDANKQVKSHTDAERNHYDSVVGLNMDILLECSRSIAEKLVKIECKPFSESIISLNDSV